MTTKRYLSNKKTTQQTISISPSLKDWIRRYVSVMHKKKPEEEYYKSISAFYCYILEKVLKIFQEGKSLDDFDRLVSFKRETGPNKYEHRYYYELGTGNALYLYHPPPSNMWPFDYYIGSILLNMPTFY